ncbi:IS110 family transposase [Bacillus sp. FSL K6-3431]|uniref:IS110 family transposase n=1 Tax=Bacillus sp. FSL K6-3431 TaxID=2921500 RepID=UPI0030FCF787
MNPVIGLDVAKGESQVQAYLERKKPYKKSFKVRHDLDGLASLLDFIKEVEDISGERPPLVMESTGHYHALVYQYFEEKGYLIIIVNPLISYKAKSSSLRKVKTDVIDAHHLCELYYKEDLEPYKKRGIQLMNLRHLTRQHDNITGMFVQTKLQFQAVLDQIFPEYSKVFGSLYSDVSLKILQAFPTSEDVLNTDIETLTAKIKEFCNSRSLEWANKQAEKLMIAAEQNPFRKTLYSSLALSLDNMLFERKKHLSMIENEIDALVQDIEESKIIRSIPGIGEKIAATIISEIGEIERFNDPKKLVAFAGLDPSVFESGTFKGTRNRITKRGSSRLRQALYMAVKCAIRDCRKQKTTDEILPRNKRLRAFYDKKREEEKPFRVAVIACANKLLHWIYAKLPSKI